MSYTHLQTHTDTPYTICSILSLYKQSWRWREGVPVKHLSLSSGPHLQRLVMLVYKSATHITPLTMVSYLHPPAGDTKRDTARWEKVCSKHMAEEAGAWHWKPVLVPHLPTLSKAACMLKHLTDDQAFV